MEGTLHKLMDRISKTDLLIVDDFGLVNLDQQQRLDLMEIIEDRYAKASTIIASQLPVASWYDVIGEDTIAVESLNSPILSLLRAICYFHKLAWSHLLNILKLFVEMG